MSVFGPVQLSYAELHSLAPGTGVLESWEGRKQEPGMRDRDRGSGGRSRVDICRPEVRDQSVQYSRADALKPKSLLQDSCPVFSVSNIE